jgi:16S rRNA (cytidine1402-2'-O)-methyltransferase
LCANWFFGRAIASKLSIGAGLNGPAKIRIDTITGWGTHNNEARKVRAHHNVAKMASLFLIPAPLSDQPGATLATPALLEAVHALTYFVVENAKAARATLKRYAYPRPLAEAHLLTLNEHSRAADVQAALAPLLAGQDVGLMSDAGCPAIADPGADLVRLAHQHGVRVVPLVGPSSILLALMASGLNGQRFRFCGYLPTQRAARIKAIRAVEQRSLLERETQIFIETPYRSQVLFDTLIEACDSATLLCVASALTSPQEHVMTQTVQAWRRAHAVLAREPVVFLLLGGS